MTTTALISCSKRKCPEACEARFLYEGPLFEKSRKYAIRNADQYFILSALLGIVSPGKLIGPYDMTMKDKTATERRIWAHRIAGQLRGIIHDGDTLIILAGRLYRDELLIILKRRYSNLDIQIPLEGLGIGQQLQFLTKENAHNE